MRSSSSGLLKGPNGVLQRTSNVILNVQRSIAEVSCQEREALLGFGAQLLGLVAMMTTELTDGSQVRKKVGLHAPKLQQL